MTPEECDTFPPKAETHQVRELGGKFSKSIVIDGAGVSRGMHDVFHDAVSAIVSRSDRRDYDSAW